MLELYEKIYREEIECNFVEVKSGSMEQNLELQGLDGIVCDDPYTERRRIFWGDPDTVREITDDLKFGDKLDVDISVNKQIRYYIKKR